MSTERPPHAPRRWVRVLRSIAEVGTILVAIPTLFLWCSVPNTSPLATENPTTTAFIDLRREQAAAAGRRFDLKFAWKPLGKVSRYLRAAVVYAEDMRFYDHDGVDWDAIENAIQTNVSKGSLAIGGSTITMQLAKNLYLSPSRSFLRKAREILIAGALEDDLSKQRILEIYLNVVEWGDGVFGAEAAAQKWFRHSAQSLTPAEAVRLAIALPNPFERAPNVTSPSLTKKAIRLIRLLRIQGLIDRAQERVALDAVGAPTTPVLERTPSLADLDEEPPEPLGPIMPGDAAVAVPSDVASDVPIDAPIDVPEPTLDPTIDPDGGATAPY
ncbi:MAG: monofunctional biosynthetic peptidoglycan transglycosylase [Kofleriaceae bacterium]